MSMLKNSIKDGFVFLCSLSIYSDLGIVEIRLRIVTETKNCFLVRSVQPHKMILAGTLTGLQGDIRCKVLVALSTVK